MAACCLALAPTTARMQAPTLRWDGGATPLAKAPGGSAPSTISRQAVSHDGRFVVFTTSAALFPIDTNATWDVFLSDRQLGTVTAVSVAATGGPADGRSDSAAISGDGRWVAFHSCATNLVGDDTNGVCDVFLEDTQAGAIWRVSGNTGDPTLVDGESSRPTISADGRFIAFESYHSGQASGIWLVDRDTDGNGTFDEPGTVATTLASVATDGAPANSSSYDPMISPDGRYLAFTSYATNLGVSGTAQSRMYIRDLQTGVTNHLWAGVYFASFSYDGAVVAWQSSAASTYDDFDSTSDVFVSDPSGSYVTCASCGLPFPAQTAAYPTVSHDGRYVTFQAQTASGYSPGGTHTWTYDRETRAVTQVDLTADGNQPNGSCGSFPSMSGDGTTIVFAASGTNYLPGITSDTFAAFHFGVTPVADAASGAGGTRTIAVDTTPVTRWAASADVPWITVGAPGGVGSGTLSYTAEPYEGPQRTAHILLGARHVTITQPSDPLAVLSVSPAAGPQLAATTVTITGTGFVNGAQVSFGAAGPATSVTFNTPGSLTAVTPAWMQTGTVDVTVTNPDGTSVTRTGAYTYTDATPPDVLAIVTGSAGTNGWYVGDVTITWSVADPNSAITSTTGCSTTVLTFDTRGLTYTCSATSAGGTRSTSVTVKRDATPPLITLNVPDETTFPVGSVVDYRCSADQAAVVDCVGTQADNEVLAPQTPGYYHFSVVAHDEAGNAATKDVEYAIEQAICLAPPSGLVHWWRGEQDTADAGGQRYASSGVVSSYVQGKAGYAFSPGYHEGLTYAEKPDMRMSSAMSTAAWVKRSRFETTFAHVLLAKPGEYEIGYAADGTLQWRFGNAGAGYDWVRTGYQLTPYVWMHVAVTYDAGVVNAYVNGRLVHTYTGSGNIVDANPASNDLHLFSVEDVVDDGTKPAADEIQLYNRALSADEVSSLFFAGGHGACPPAGTTVTGTSATATYHQYATLEATLTSGGAPVAGRTVRFSIENVDKGSALTGADGIARLHNVDVYGWNAGTYDNVLASFDGDITFASSAAWGTMAIDKAVPRITWATPAPIVYGTPLGVRQLSATVGVDGYLTFSPPIGTVLNAGAGQTLSASFSPMDGRNYTTASATVTIDVSKAQPVVTWAKPGSIPYPTPLGATQLNATANVPGTFTYSPAAGTVLNAGTGQTLTVTFAPTDAANYASASAATTIDVAKAQPAVSWPQPPAITYGTPLGAAQLNATATVPGTFAYSPAAGTVLPAGAGRTLSVTFTPADLSNYGAASETRTLNVTPAPLTVRANDATKFFTAPLPSFSATAAGLVNGDTLASLAGVLTFATTATQGSMPGTYPIVASGVTSTNYAIAFVAGALSVVPAPTAVVVGSSPNPSGWGQPMTFSATVVPVAPASGVPSGALQFFDGSTLLGTAPLLAGSAVLSTSGLSAGAHIISAQYAGDGGYAAGSGSVSHTVNTAIASTTVAVTTSANPASPGQTVALTATVSLQGGTPEGSVDFVDGDAVIATVALSGGSAVYRTSALAAGSHAITARYAGNGAATPGISPVFIQAVGTKLRTATLGLAASPSPSALREQVVFTATVSGGAGRTPTGLVQFFVDGSAVDLPVALAPTGGVSARASFSLATLAHGTHTVTAAYLGDHDFKGVARAVSQPVN